MQHFRMNRPHSRGFTLLEAIVALSLLAGAGAALFTWLNSNILTLSRVQEAHARAEASRNILEYMETINPMLVPEGKAEWGSIHFHWRAEPVTPPQDGAGYPTGTSLYRIALYKTHIEILKEGSPWFELNLRQVGYKKVREMRLPF